VFSGWYALSVDDKGRIAIPAPFRQLLSKMPSSGPLFLTPQPHDEKPHVEVYPQAEFERIAGQIDALDDREMAELLKQEVIGRSVLVEIDGNGRIVLPPWLRTEVALGTKVIVEGRISRFDIIDEALYQSRRPDPERLRAAMRLIKR
jgi:MraZ protein